MKSEKPKKPEFDLLNATPEEAYERGREIGRKLQEEELQNFRNTSVSTDLSLDSE